MSLNKVRILDCSKISGPLEGIENTTAFQEFTSQLAGGMSGMGFVYLINHDVKKATVENMFDKTLQFFQLPSEVKRKYRKEDAVENFNGYTAAEDEMLDEVGMGEKGLKMDYKECLDFWGPALCKESGYPHEIPGLKSTVDDFRSSLVLLAKKLYLSFGFALGLEDPHYLIGRHKSLDDMRIASNNHIRMNYYMAVDDPENIPAGAMRLTEHQDWGTLSFLIQDQVGGLQAKSPTGDWVSVPPIEGSIVLNAGSMLEIWSGGRFAAAVHRVKLSKEDAARPRLSFAFFTQPDGDSQCKAIVEERKGWTPYYPKDDSKTHDEYFRDRVQGSRAY